MCQNHGGMFQLLYGWLWNGFVQKEWIVIIPIKSNGIFQPSGHDETSNQCYEIKDGQDLWKEDVGGRHYVCFAQRETEMMLRELVAGGAESSLDTLHRFSIQCHSCWYLQRVV